MKVQKDRCLWLIGYLAFWVFFIPNFRSTVIRKFLSRSRGELRELTCPSAKQSFPFCSITNNLKRLNQWKIGNVLIARKTLSIEGKSIGGRRYKLKWTEFHFSLFCRGTTVELFKKEVGGRASGTTYGPRYNIWIIYSSIQTERSFPSCGSNTMKYFLRKQILLNWLNLLCKFKNAFISILNNFFFKYYLNDI